MRIITGSAKGVKLKSVKGMQVRPTADRVKESIFNILENLNLNDNLNENELIEKSSAIYQAKVLDLFAGTGNLGLEALSRGAKSAVFVDKSQLSLAVIRENIRSAQMKHLSEVIKCDAFLALAKLKKEGRLFDLIFADPPYEQGLAVRTAENIETGNILALGGILLLEHSKNEEITYNWQNLTPIRTRQYGQTMISLFRRSSFAYCDLPGQF